MLHELSLWPSCPDPVSPALRGVHPHREACEVNRLRFDDHVTSRRLRKPVTLELHNGVRVHGLRGSFARLPQTAGQLRGEFSKSGPNIWITPWESSVDPKNVAFAERESQRFRVLDREVTGQLTRTLRLQLVQQENI